MKLNRPYVVIAISSLALLIVVIIQVNWMIQAAEIKEKIFNEKANLVLSKTADALSLDTAAVKQMELGIGSNETHKIDSILSYFMKIYNIQIAYHFEVKPGTQRPKPTTVSGPDSTVTPKTSMFLPSQSQGCYQACVGGPDSGDGLRLQLVFPEKEEFILAEMGIPFISSVVLIVIVLLLTWKTMLSLIREKEISEHTTDFLNNMTHEFKTPLTNISLAGKMMTRENNIRQEEKVKHYSSIILQENDKLRLQVEHVLSMTALERGEIPLHKTELDLHQLIRDALSCISVQIENTQGSLTLHLDAQQVVITGDKTHLTNAICNLVDNAVKYSAGRPELTISTCDTAGQIELLISDKGIGIEEKYQQKVFDTFFRIPTGDLHNVKGFGLGLSYTKKIVEMHGGSIALQSEKNEGTTFTIKLPHA